VNMTTTNREVTKEEQELQKHVQHELVTKLIAEVAHWLDSWIRCNGITVSTEQCFQGLVIATLRHCQAAVIETGDLGLLGAIDAELLKRMGIPKLPLTLTEASEKLQRLKYGE